MRSRSRRPCPPHVVDRIRWGVALPSLAALAALVAFAVSSSRSSTVLEQALEWTQHAAVVHEIGAAAHAYLGALHEEVESGRPHAVAGAPARERLLLEAMLRSRELAGRFSAEEVRAEAELSDAVERLVRLARAAARARSEARLEAARRWFADEVEPRLAARAREEMEGARAATEGARAATRRWLGGALAAAAALVGVALWRSASLARYLVSSLRLLVEGARRISSGDLRHRVRFLSGDELGALARVFDEMAGTLADNLVSREELARQVSERTADLERSRGELEANLASLRSAQAQLVASERLAVVGLLAAGVAHEVNNPLVFVISNVRFAIEALGQDGRAGDRRTEVLRALGEAAGGAERVKEIVGGLKGFARDDGRAEPIEVGRAVEATLSLASNEIKRQAVLVRELGPAPRVEISESRIGQVVVNLVLNALQAMPPREPSRNEVRVATRTSPEGWAVIEVGDNGRGMGPEVEAHLFEPFFTTKPRGVGTGLGLSVCKHIVDGAGGRLSVETAVGAGTTFRVELPPASEVARAAAVPVPEGPELGRARVLVVDDEPLIGSSVRRTLARHDVEVVTSARDALERLEGPEPFDVVICDVMMPGMSGLELLEELGRSGSYAARRMVFLTGGSVMVAERARFARLDAFALEKPFEAGALRAEVDRILRVRGRAAGRRADDPAALAS